MSKLVHCSKPKHVYEKDQWSLLKTNLNKENIFEIKVLKTLKFVSLSLNQEYMSLKYKLLAATTARFLGLHREYL